MARARGAWTQQLGVDRSSVTVCDVATYGTLYADWQLDYTSVRYYCALGLYLRFIITRARSGRTVYFIYIKYCRALGYSRSRGDSRHTRVYSIYKRQTLLHSRATDTGSRALLQAGCKRTCTCAAPRTLLGLRPSVFQPVLPRPSLIPGCNEPS